MILTSPIAVMGGVQVSLLQACGAALTALTLLALTVLWRAGAARRRERAAEERQQAIEERFEALAQSSA
jgi:hypothetical protein